MATKLFLRSTMTNKVVASGEVYEDALAAAGGGATTAVTDTVASGTEVQWTKNTTADAEISWVSGRAPIGGFTVSGTVTFSIWAQESHMSANCGVGAKLFRRTPAGVETQIGTTTEYGSPTEISPTTVTEYSWTLASGYTPVALAENDRLVVKFYLTDVGTMASGYTSTLTYNAADGATGDSFVQINETVAFKPNDVGVNVSALQGV